MGCWRSTGHVYDHTYWQECTHVTKLASVPSITVTPSRILDCTELTREARVLNITPTSPHMRCPGHIPWVSVHFSATFVCEPHCNLNCMRLSIPSAVGRLHHQSLCCVNCCGCSFIQLPCGASCTDLSLGQAR